MFGGLALAANDQGKWSHKVEVRTAV